MNVNHIMDDYNQTAVPAQQQEEEEELSTFFMWMFYGILLIEAVVALVGNSLTILAVITNHGLHTVHYLLVATLAAADVASAVSVFFSLGTYLINSTNWQLWVSVCQVKLFLGRVAALGNSVFSMFIAGERYMFIIWPLRYHSLLSWERTRNAVILLWVLILALTTATLILSLLGDYNRGSIQYCFDSVLAPMFVNMIIFGLLIGPSCITGVLFWKVLIMARKQQRQIHAEQVRYGVVYPTSRQRKMTMSLGFTVLVYVVTTIILYLWGSYSRLYRVNNGILITRLLSLLYKVNTFLNPLMLAWRHEEFRRALRAVLTVSNRVREGNRPSG